MDVAYENGTGVGGERALRVGKLWDVLEEHPKGVRGRDGRK